MVVRVRVVDSANVEQKYQQFDGYKNACALYRNPCGSKTTVRVRECRTSVAHLLSCQHLCGPPNWPPMRLRVAHRANTRWKHWAVWCAAIAALVQAQTKMDEGAGLIPAAASTSAATISVADAFGVMGRLSWWGIELAMETAGYGE